MSRLCHDGDTKKYIIVQKQTGIAVHREDGTFQTERKRDGNDTGWERCRHDLSPLTSTECKLPR